MKKKKSTWENAKIWYSNRPPIQKNIIRITVLALVIIALVIAVDVPVGADRERLPSMFDKNSSLPSVFEQEISSGLPHLLTYIKRDEHPITLESILCNYIYKYNQTNMTWGQTTCIKVDYYNITDTEYDCVCYTPMG